MNCPVKSFCINSSIYVNCSYLLKPVRQHQGHSSNHHTFTVICRFSSCANTINDVYSIQTNKQKKQHVTDTALTIKLHASINFN